MAIYKVLFEKLYSILTLLTMDLYDGPAHEFWEPKRLLSLKYVLHILEWWHLAQLYLIQRKSKKYINHVIHHLSSAGISIFSTKIRKFWYTEKYRYRLYVNAWLLVLLTLFEPLKVFLINMVGNMSAKL